MAIGPLSTPYTPQELAAGRLIAAVLWVISGILLLMLASWSAGPT